MKSKEKVLVDELLALMPVESDGDWGPQPITCRWCACWLESIRAVEHEPDCFAVEYLGQKAVCEEYKNLSIFVSDIKGHYSIG